MNIKTKKNRSETWLEGVELLTIWFKKSLKRSGDYLVPQSRNYTSSIGREQIRIYDESERKIQFRPCLIETDNRGTELRFPFPGEEFLAIFASREVVVCGSVFGSSLAITLPKDAILRVRKSGRRMFREENPTCNWCNKESDRRAAIKLPEDTPPGNAEFVENGKPYGCAYWGCNGCLKRLAKELDLQIFND